MSARVFDDRDARKAEALELGRAFAGFRNAVFLPRDSREPLDAASGVTESSEDAEDEKEDWINSANFGFVAGTTAFYFGTIAGFGRTNFVADTSDTNSSLGIQRRTRDSLLSIRCDAATAAVRRSLGEAACEGCALCSGSGRLT